MKRIVVHIDRLVLRGVDPAAADAVAAALQAELRAHLQMDASAPLQTSPVRLPAAVGSAALGEAVAARVGGKLAGVLGEAK